MFLEKKIFSFLDLRFARSLEPDHEKTLLLFCYLFAAARHGHLCVRLEGGSVFPDPESFTDSDADAALLGEKIIEAFSLFPSDPTEDFHKIPRSPVCRVGNRLYLRKNLVLETRFIEEIRRLQKTDPFFSISEKKGSSSLHPLQSIALERALSSPLSVISGGPGTGKTFTAGEIVRVFLDSVPEDRRPFIQVKLAAPTGKAAALLEKNSAGVIDSSNNVVCKTLHSLLETGASEQRFQKNIFADLLLVDEASMVDARLFVSLLTRLLPGGRLVLMGDKDQLPPVEAGGFFSDLIGMSRELSVPVTILEKSIRTESSLAREPAEAVLRQDLEAIRRVEGVEVVPSFVSSAVQDRVADKLKQYFFFPSEGAIDPLEVLRTAEKFRILVPLRKGPWGVDLLNERILRMLLHQIPPGRKMVCPVLITENDSSRNLMNGETGVLVAAPSSITNRIFTSEDRAYFFGKTETDLVRDLPASILPPFSYAYALSVHKTQGSEYDSVLVLVPPGSERFGREVLYTAVTRAKKEVSLLVEESTLRSLLGKSSRKISGLSKLS